MSRLILFIITGAFCIGGVAAVEAYLSFVGHAAITSIGAPAVKETSTTCMSAGLAFFLPIALALVGGAVGAVVGATAFGYAGAASYRHPDAESLLGEVSQQASLGSVLGWIVGGALGMAITAMWSAIAKSPAVPVEEGLLWGLILGSALGVFGGAVRAIQPQPTTGS